MITVIGTLKGGSGKSTLTFNLGLWLALAEVEVRLIDADPQATLTDVIAVRHEEGLTPALEVEDRSSLDHLTEVPHETEVLIDIGISDMDALKQALKVCDRVIMPIPPSQADIWSTQRFLRQIQAIDRPTPPEVIGFINRGDTHHAVRETDETAAALVSLAGLQFIKPRLSQRTIFRRSFSEGMGVFELEPRGKASREFHALVAVLFPHLLR